MTTTGEPPRRRGRRVRGAPRGGAQRAGRRTRPLWAAASTLRPSSSVKVPMPSPMAGLATRSKAPSARASTARAPWAGEKADTTTVGTLVARPSRSARSTPMPSRPGIARSSVIASGRWSRHAASASSPSAAVATTSKPCRPSASESIRRIRRESSATTTRCLEPASTSCPWFSVARATPPARRAPRRPLRRTGPRRSGARRGGRRSWRWPRSTRGWPWGRPRAASASTVSTSSTWSTMTPTCEAPVSTITILPGSVSAAIGTPMRAARSKIGMILPRRPITPRIHFASDATERGSV